MPRTRAALAWTQPARSIASSRRSFSVSPPEPRRKHSTPPAPFTSPASGTNPTPNPQRTYGANHLGVALGVAEGAALAGTDFVTVTVGTDAGLYALLPHPAAGDRTTGPATSVLHCMWPVSGIRIISLPLSTVCFKNAF